MKVVKKKNFNISEHEYDVNHIEKDKVYTVICIEECGWYRLLNEKNDPALYPSIAFNIIDSSIPNDWVFEEMDEKNYVYEDDNGNSLIYFGPKIFLTIPYFFEEYFNGSLEAKKIFLEFLDRE